MTNLLIIIMMIWKVYSYNQLIKSIHNENIINECVILYLEWKN